MSPNPIKVTRSQAARLERNLAGQGKQKRKPEDPQKTIQRLRAENAALRELLREVFDQQQKIIDALHREIGAKQ